VRSSADTSCGPRSFISSSVYSYQRSKVHSECRPFLFPIMKSVNRSGSFSRPARLRKLPRAKRSKAVTLASDHIDVTATFLGQAPVFRRDLSLFVLLHSRPSQVTSTLDWSHQDAVEALPSLAGTLQPDHQPDCRSIGGSRIFAEGLSRSSWVPPKPGCHIWSLA
jgi:hypothetical protein